MNGLDYVEITADDQRTIAVYFLGKAPAPVKLEGHSPRAPIRKNNVRIEGGRRVRDIRVTDVAIHRRENPREDDWMEIKVDKAGDFSPYTLRLVETDQRGHSIIERDDSGRERFRPFPGFDPRYSAVEFSFKPQCPAELDCKTVEVCPPVKRAEPEINYLAKDYASFRQLILDRLALIMPDWRERHVPDIGVALVEILAYAADYLSYYQDAVATEAYLETARERISVRRHVRLLDYFLHEGCNARAWLFVQVPADRSFRRDEIAFMTAPEGSDGEEAGALRAADVDKLPAGSFEYFEPMAEELSFREAHNEVCLYTWGDAQCCIPQGSTSAILVDGWVPAAPPEADGEEKTPDQEGDYESCHPCHPGLPPPGRKLHFQKGDFVLFEEVIGPRTGNPADKDPTRRHVVRLIRVTAIEDPLFRKRLPGYKADFATPLLEIEWHAADALPFALCISAIGPATAEPPRRPCQLIENISVARGNVILVDHGRTVPEAPFDPVPAETSDVVCEGEERPSELTVTPAKFGPRLQGGPLVFAQRLPRKAAATALFRQDPRKTVPAIKLRSATEPNEWLPSADLLRSRSDDAHFVVETDEEGVAHLRFGDGEMGRLPEAGMVFQAVYRIGGGVGGNVGAETISQVVWPGPENQGGETLHVRNPLPAHGGTRPEPIAEAKLFAPRGFRKELQRAITADDYAAIVMREFPAEVQRAGAELRWTGGWYTVRVAIDPRGSSEASPALLAAIARKLHRYRRIAHDVQVVLARYVPIDVEITVCVRPHFLRGHVQAALLDVFRSGLRGNGEPGFFHPDRLSFGEAVHVSRLVAAGYGVEGVESVEVTRLERLFIGPKHELENGLLPIGPLEVARLDGDPLNPEHGKLRIEPKGGR